MNMNNRMCIKSLLLTLTLLLIIGLPAAAQEEAVGQQTMDDVVVTATRSEENIKNIPTKVEVIDSQTIELTIGGTITEQLKKIALSV